MDETARQPGTGVQLHLIAFKAYRASVSFVRDMRVYVHELRPQTRTSLSEIDTVSHLKEALRKSADVTLVSGYGPSFTGREVFTPLLSDDRGITPQVCDFPRIGARSGIIWDVCNVSSAGESCTGAGG
jgi:hypothetical protein